jgi:hypothetical protein
MVTPMKLVSEWRRLTGKYPKTTTLWKYVGVLAVVAVALGVLSALMNETTILRLQERFGIPGRQFRVGLAEFERSDQWPLLSSRRMRDESPRMYGMFPIWLVRKPSVIDMERFFVFRDGSVTVSFVEENERKATEAAEALARSTLAKAPSSSKLKRGMFHGYDSLELRDDNMSMVIIPSLRATITISPPSASLEAAISMVEVRQGSR